MALDRPSRLALISGASVPVLYFGAQLVRGPFVDGYSFRRNAASDLGADGVPGAVRFNALAIASGVAAIVGAIGWWRALAPWHLRRGVRPVLTAAVISVGVASVAAGVFPLPDDRHGGGALGIGLFAFPALFVIATLRTGSPRWVARYAIVNLALFGAAALMFSGATSLDPQMDEGIMQRVLACSVFVPIGVVSVAALRSGTTIAPGRGSTAAT